MTRNFSRGILVAALACAILPSSARAESQPHAASSPSRPNIIFILMDDLRWDEMDYPFVTGPEHPAHRARGGALPQRVRDHAALLAQPCEHPHRPVRAQARHHRQHRSQPAQPRAGDVPAPAARRRLRDGVHRQVAHGPRRQRAARNRSLGQREGAGQLPRSRVQRERQAREDSGLLHRHPQPVRTRLPEAEARQAVSALPLAQGGASRPGSER